MSLPTCTLLELLHCYANCQEFCDLVIKKTSLKFKLQLNILKTKIINAPNNHILVILLYFTIIYTLGMLFLLSLYEGITIK